MSINTNSAYISGNGYISYIRDITTTIYQFACIKGDQTLFIPSNAIIVTIQCWGAGGARQGIGGFQIYNTGYGGGGGFTQATLNSNNAGQTLKIIVGEGGKFYNYGAAAPVTYGGGGNQRAPNGPEWGSASGGGRSAVQLMNNGIYDDIVTAGGGGSAGGSFPSVTTKGFGSGGSGGGSIGGNANDNANNNSEGGSGGTQTAGGSVGTTTAGGTGSNGTKYSGGGNSTYGAGGGGGYYGGGAGGISVSYIFGGGGGGSSYVDLLYATSQYMLQGNAGTVAGSTYLPSGVSNIGNGAPETDAVNGGANGKDGYIVIAVTTP